MSWHNAPQRVGWRLMFLRVIGNANLCNQQKTKISELMRRPTPERQTTVLKKSFEFAAAMDADSTRSPEKGRRRTFRDPPSVWIRRGEMGDAVN